MPGRIEYNSINVDIARHFNEFAYPIDHRRVDLESSSRIDESLSFASKGFISATRNFLTSQEVVELERFYEYAKDGSTFKFWRDWNLGCYLSFEGADHTTVGDSLATNDGVAGTFTRTGVTDAAYYVDPSTGLLTNKGATATNNVPRYPAGKYGRAIIIEGARPNLITYPSDFSNVAWTKSTMTVSTNTAETADPIGTNIADKLTATAATAQVYFITGTSISTNDGAFSVWLKSPSGDVSGIVRLTDDAATFTSDTVITVTPEWQQFSVGYSNPGSNANLWVGLIQIDTNTEIVYAIGASLEAGADVLFASSSIGVTTAGSSITRNAELLTYPSTDIINAEKGTIAFWFYPYWQYDEHPTLKLINVGKAALDFIDMQVLSNGNMQLEVVNGDGTSTVTTSAAASSITQNAWNLGVIVWDTTAATQNGQFWVNDSKILSADSGAFNPALSDTIVIGGSIGGGAEAFAVFDEVEIWKDVKDATWVNQKYNRNKGAGYRRNYWSSVKLANPSFNPLWKQGDYYGLTLEMKEVNT